MFLVHDKFGNGLDDPNGSVDRRLKWPGNPNGIG